MATGNSGSFTISGTKYMSAVCYWSETYNVAANTHVVSIDKIMLKSSSWYGYTYYLSGSVKVNGTSVITFNSTLGSHNCTVSSKNTEYKINAASGYTGSPWASGSITGNTDGTCSVTITLSFYGYTLDGTGANGFQINSSNKVSLYTIPRKSSVSIPASTMGTATAITITRASSSFTHTLTYAFGNATGTIATKTSATSVSWTPPLTLASEIPNSTSGTCTITCKTYSGSTLIGSSTATCTLSVPDSVKPTMTSLTVERVDGKVPAEWEMYIQTKSKATLTINGAAGVYGSTVAAYSISGGGFSSTSETFTTGYLLTSGTVTFTAKVKDSRGRWSDESTVSIEVVPYTAPSFSDYSVQRCTSDGVISTDGTYCKATVYFSYSSCNGKNAITTTTYYKKSSASIYTNADAEFTSGTEFIFGEGNLETDYTYYIKFKIADSIGSVNVETSLSTAAVVMDFKSGGTGIGIGKVAEEVHLLDIALPTKFRSGVSGNVMALDGCDDVIDGNFNNYKDPGIYVCETDDDMTGISNRPCDICGTLYVKNTFNDSRAAALANTARIQIFIPRDPSTVYFRSISCGDTVGDWTYGSWVAHGTAGGVQYAETANKDADGNEISSTYLPVDGGTMTGTLILSKTTEASGTANKKPALIVGGTATAAHLEFDANEVMAKASGTTTAALYLNNEGGIVYVNGYKNFYTSLIGYGSMSLNSTISGTVPSDTRLFVIAIYDTSGWYSMAVPATSFTSGSSLHLMATSDYYKFTIKFSGTTATLTKTGDSTKTVYFIAIR